MKRSALGIGLLAVLATSACAPVTTAAGPRYGVCRQAMSDFVHSRFGQTITHIEVQSYAERTPPTGLFDAGSALVYVEECNGFHSFEVRGTETICEHIPHYGAGGSGYVRYEGAFKGCKTG